jgi:nicotinamidase-related amidase
VGKKGEFALMHDANVLLEYTRPVVLRPPSTALMIIDMQYLSACRTTGMGRWLNDNGRADEGRYRFDRIEQLLVPNIRTLLSFFREHRLQVVHVVLASQMEGARDVVAHSRVHEAEFGNEPGRIETQILDELAPTPNEPVVQKLSASAFNSSNIDFLLRSLGIDTVVVAGVSTSQCVGLTAHDAADRGYGVAIVEDACAEDIEEHHVWTLEQFRRVFGRVATTAEVVTELQDALAASVPVDSY